MRHAMSSTMLTILLASVALSAEPAAIEVTARPFADGDVVAFIGDSITAADKYREMISVFYYTRYPARRIQMWNRGVSGDTAEKALARLEDDILLGKPNRATIMLGMNEGRYFHGKEDPETVTRRTAAAEAFRRNLPMLVQRLQEQRMEVTLIGPSIYDQTMVDPEGKNPFRGYSDTLERYRDFVGNLAKERSCGFVDFTTPMLRINAAVQRKDPAATIIGSDRVHPGWKGNFVMSYVLLTSQGVQGEVARVEIDAARGQQTAAANCTIRDLQATEGRISFTYDAKSLPFPVDATQYAEGDALVPFTRDLNRETILVRGLAGNTWTLDMDGVPLGSYSVTELATGVNIAINPRCPTQVHAKAVETTANQLNRTMQDYRTITFAEHFLREDRIDPGDQQATARFISDFLAKEGSSRNVNKFGTYKRYLGRKAKEAQLIQDLARFQQDISAANQPKPHQVHLTREQ